MNDRTSIIISAILHLGLISYFLFAPHSRFVVPQGGGGIGIAMTMPNVPPAQPQAKAQIPKPEPPKPQPKEEIKPEKPKPQLSEDTIRELQDKLKAPTPKKPTPQKPVNTRTPQPTKNPTVKSTPTRAPTPTRTPAPKINNMVPLENITTNPAANAASITKSASDFGKAVGPSVGGTSAGYPGLSGKGGGLYIEGQGGYDFTGYGSLINLFLARNWRPPSVRPPENRDYAAVVGFTVFKEGTISNINIIESSGWVVMDQTVKEAVERSSPMEPLPMSYTADNIQVRVQFVLPQK